jgi:pimeloyl-ACP methyl ester carboxylesterase
MCRHRHVAIVMLLVLLVACAPAATPTPTVVPITTATPVPTPTPPPEGKVSVGAYELYYRCRGAGSPTVIVEAGFKTSGASSRTWTAVELGVQETTRICVYDRATLGASGDLSAVRTAADVALDLHNLLQNAHIGGPLVLVGHSFGGWFVRMYAAAYPDEVAGIVLVEAVPPDWLLRLMAVLPPKSSDEPTALAAYRTESETLFNSTSGAQGERLNIAASAAQAAQVTSLGDMPLVVLSESPATGRAQCSLTPDLCATLEDAWQQAQLEQSRLSTSGSLVVAPTAGHMISMDAPQLIVDAILKVVEEARQR